MVLELIYWYQVLTMQKDNTRGLFEEEYTDQGKRDKIHGLSEVLFFFGGALKAFESMTPKAQSVDWNRLVQFAPSIPKPSFTSWPTILSRLSTPER